MSLRFRNKCRRRQRVIRDRRGLPAKRMPAERAGRHFWLLMYWVKRNGICVITEDGKPTSVILDPESDPKLMQLIEARAAAALLRKRNPGGVFTLADEVFGDRASADLWLVEGIWGTDNTRPLDLLATAEGVEKVMEMLQRIRHGLFA